MVATTSHLHPDLPSRGWHANKIVIVWGLYGGRSRQFGCSDVEDPMGEAREDSLSEARF